MSQIYVIKGLDIINGKITLLDCTQKVIEATKICETDKETTVISVKGIATVLGFIGLVDIWGDEITAMY